MSSSLTTLASLALLLATSPSLISARPAPQAASTPTPSTTTASSSSFNCTPFDISQLRPFDSRFPLYLANLLSYAPPIDQIVPLGFNGSDVDLGSVADRDQGTGYWGFEVCEGFEGVDTSSTTYNTQTLYGHVIYSPNNKTVSTVRPPTEYTCLAVQGDPEASDYSHLPLISVPCNHVSGALADQRGSIFRLDNHVNNENALFLLGPGEEEAYNATYSAGPGSFNATTGEGLDLQRNGLTSEYAKFFFSNPGGATTRN